MSDNYASAVNQVRPNHVAIIMDGNGRWGTKKGIGRLEGHRRGVSRVRTIVEGCIQMQIPYLTLFAFSSENWKRPPQEVEWLMRLLSNSLDKEVQELHANNVQLNFIGDLRALSPTIQERIEKATHVTSKNTALVLTIAINYGGRWDLTQCCKQIAELVQKENLSVDEISPELISHNLITGSLPEPDFFIRTGGEKRISNFLLWQLAYTELYFSDIHWPDFDQEQFLLALQAFSKRIRRFGGIITDS